MKLVPSIEMLNFIVNNLCDGERKDVFKLAAFGAAKLVKEQPGDDTHKMLSIVIEQALALLSSDLNKTQDEVGFMLGENLVNSANAINWKATDTLQNHFSNVFELKM